MLELRGATLIDGTGADPDPGVTVTVEGDRITAVGRIARAAAKSDDTVLDLDGLTLMPGLIDAHTHLGIVDIADSGRTAPAVLAAEIFKNCELALDAGFTTVRDVGGIDGGVAEAVALGLVAGPRILPSGPLLSQKGGHGDHGPAWFDHHAPSVPGLSQLGMVCDGPDEVRRAARIVLRRGATQVKVCISGGVLSYTDRITDTQFTVDELRAAVEEAAARDTYVTAHAHHARAIVNGLAAGIECFEHGSYLDEATATAMAQRGAYLVPTLAVTRLLVEEREKWGVPEDLLGRIEGIGEAMAASAKLARDAGVVIGSGSDILGPSQQRRGLELCMKAEIFGPMEAITSATSTNARIIRRPEIGSVADGQLADLVALRGDPLEDPGLFEDAANIVVVVKGGEIVKDTR